MNGANYTYLLQFSGKILGVLGAAATLFDAVATSAVSAATASAYLAGEFAHFPIKESILAICILLSLTAVSFFGMRESSGLALSFTIVHVSSDRFLSSPSEFHMTADCHVASIRGIFNRLGTSWFRHVWDELVQAAIKPVRRR